MEITRARITVAAVGIFLTAVAWQFVTYNGFSNDHYVHVARGRQLLLGELPVRDFVDPGQPLQYVISAVSRWWLGDVAGSELLVVALGMAVGAASTMVAASWLARSTIAGSVVALLIILASPRSYSYPKIMLYGMAGCAVVAIATRATRARLVLAAVLTAVAFLMRHDHGLFIGVTCSAAMMLSAPTVATAARRVGFFAAVIAVMLLPWAVWVQVYQGLIPYFETGIAFSRREADISLLRDLPRLQLSAGLTTENIQAWLYYLFWALPVAAVALAGWRRFTRRDRWAGAETTAVGAIALMAFVIDASFLRNPLGTRLADAVVPASLLGAWLLGLAWTMGPQLWKMTLARTLSVLLVATTTVAICGIGDVPGQLDEAGAFAGVENVLDHATGVMQVLSRPEKDARHLPSRVSAGLVPFFHYLDRCSATTDRLLVAGPYPDVLVLARRGFAGGHISFMQAIYHSDAEQQLTLSRMRRQSVPFVVIPLDDIDTFAQDFPRLMAHVSASYDVLADVPVDGLKGVRLLVERERPHTRVDSETGWPCFAAARPQT